MSCINCGRDLHQACANPRSSSECCGQTSLCPSPVSLQGGELETRSQTARRGGKRHPRDRSTNRRASDARSSNDSINDLDNDTDLVDNETSAISKSKRKRGRPVKEPGELKDVKGTERKRAAELYPLDYRASCEWQGLANCGGGKHPIVGCRSGRQRNRHHGPDKDTGRNEDGNVHRICSRCHNLWHEWNDEDYDPEILHSPRDADPGELVLWDNPLTRPKAEISRIKEQQKRENDGKR